MIPTSRRAFALGLGAACFAPAFSASAKTEAPIPTLPLDLSVAPEAGKPVRDDAWIDAQIAEAERLFGPLGVHFRKAAQRPLADKYARLETRKDRDALAAERHKGVINVFLVASLRDVDDPRLYRMGVHWHHQVEKRKHFIIVSGDALPTTLAHELGHYFGNPHTSVVNNLMSYNRNGAEVFLDDKQASRIRTFARLYVRSGELVP
jgi:hypothetical protein